jgi:hypothetical protein
MQQCFMHRLKVASLALAATGMWVNGCISDGPLQVLIDRRSGKPAYFA